MTNAGNNIPKSAKKFFILSSGIYLVKNFKKTGVMEATHSVNPYGYSDRPLFFSASEVKKISDLYEISSMDGPIAIPTEGFDTVLIALDND